MKKILKKISNHEKYLDEFQDHPDLLGFLLLILSDSCQHFVSNLARAYKNDSSIGNVFGKALRGRRVKNDYVIDSSNSIYPYAKQIEFKEEVRSDSTTFTRGLYWYFQVGL